MTRSERDETLTTPTSEATREPGVSPNVLRRRGGVCRFVVTLLCLVITFQPSYALAGNLVATRSRQNSSCAPRSPASTLHALATLSGVMNDVTSVFASEGSNA